MRGFWRRRSSGSDLEGVLRANRPEPRAEFVRMLTARINDSRPRRAVIRLAAAAALTLMMVSALMAFGGIGYASAAIEQMGQLAQGLNPQRGDDKSAVASRRSGGPKDDQYKEERKQCRRAEQQLHNDIKRDIKQDYARCQREEQQRHHEAIKACGNDKACRDAEDARHEAEVRRCKEERERREQEEQERHERAKEACENIGR